MQYAMQVRAVMKCPLAIAVAAVFAGGCTAVERVTHPSRSPVPANRVGPAGLRWSGGHGQTTRSNRGDGHAGAVLHR
jgi:hypothetical protein